MIWKKQPVGSKLSDLQNNKASKDTATQSAAGLMSASDKTKLDGIATGATAVSVVNNLNSDSTTSALSAAQGKALNSKLTVQTVTNLNDATETGFYYFASNASNIPRVNTAGTLFVIVGSSNLVTQLAISSNYLYVRRKASGSWNEWAEK